MQKVIIKIRRKKLSSDKNSFFSSVISVILSFIKKAKKIKKKSKNMSENDQKMEMSSASSLPVSPSV